MKLENIIVVIVFSLILLAAICMCCSYYYYMYMNNSSTNINIVMTDAKIIPMEEDKIQNIDVETNVLPVAVL